jgi:hypothetical protein
LTQENSRSDQKALIMPKTKKTKKGGSRPSDYFPDMDQWPNDWMGIEEDLEIGRGLLALLVLRLTAAARNERRAVERKIPLPFQRGAKPDQERNGINVQVVRSLFMGCNGEPKKLAV